MTIFKRQALWTLVALLLLAGAGRFFLNAYQQHRLQRAELDRIRFRQDFVNRQVAELQHKINVIKQVNAFAGGAADLGLVPANWTRYEVDIEAPLKFPALADILRQCTSTAYYYFQPDHLKVHLAGQPVTDGGELVDEPLSAEAAAGSAEGGDLFLKLKGSFLARRR